jgi:membrane protein required for colicin V production
MNLADWLIIGVVVMSIAVAAAQGFVYEIFSLAGVVVGYLAAVWGYSRVATWYAPLVKMPWVANIAGFLTIFLLVLFFVGFIAKLARWGITKGGLRWFDRLLGGVFGLLRGMLVATVVLVAAGSWAPSAPWLAQSQIAPYLLMAGRAAVCVAPSEVRTQFQQGMQQLRQLRLPQKARGDGKK